MRFKKTVCLTGLFLTMGLAFGLTAWVSQASAQGLGDCIGNSAVWPNPAYCASKSDCITADTCTSVIGDPCSPPAPAGECTNVIFGNVVAIGGCAAYKGYSCPFCPGGMVCATGSAWYYNPMGEKLGNWCWPSCYSCQIIRYNWNGNCR
jgi:hypothetical protein